MDREDITESAKKEFSTQINKQEGEISSRIIENPKYLTKDQKDSWNRNGFILLKNFCSEEIIDNHISSYLEHSPLSAKDAYKKIKLSKLIFSFLSYSCYKYFSCFA